MSRELLIPSRASRKKNLCLKYFKHKFFWRKEVSAFLMSLLRVLAIAVRYSGELARFVYFSVAK